MSKIVRHRGNRGRQPLSKEAGRLLRRLAEMQQTQQRASITVAELLGTTSQRAVNALLALDQRSLIAKATNGGIRLTRQGWVFLRSFPAN